MDFPINKITITRKHIFWFIIGTLALFGGVCTLLRHPYKANVIYDLDNRKLNDVVVRCYQYKDDSGPQVATLLKNNDTAFCFTGFEKKTRLWYPDYIHPGDSLIKELKSNTFYVKRKDTVATFDIYMCNSYFTGDNSQK